MLERLTNSPKALVFLQFIPVLLIPPSQFKDLLILAVVEVIFLIAVIVGVYREKAWSQTLSIFVMGFNFITKLMVFFPHIVSADGQVDYLFGVLMISSIILSGLFLYLMDQPHIAVRLSR